jgi:hypothetical protein
LHGPLAAAPLVLNICHLIFGTLLRRRGSASPGDEQTSRAAGRSAAQQPSTIADYDDASLGPSEDEEDIDEDDAML